MGSPTTHVVVGGGIAGLLAARRLARGGATVTLLEAADHWGGRVSSLELDSLVLDAGAESFATRGGVMTALVSELGLESAIVAPTSAPAWVVSPERSYPLPATGWLGIPLRPFESEVRRILGWRGAVRTLSDRWRSLGSVPDDITVGALVRDRLGDAVADLLVAPVIAGVYSRSIDEIPLASIAPGLPAEVRAAGSLIKAATSRRKASPGGSAVLGIEGGLARLTGALVSECEAAGVRLFTNARVASIAPGTDDWRVVVDGAGVSGGAKFVADAVVIAVPLPMALQWFPDIGSDAARYVALVTLVLDAPALDAAPRGTGVLTTGAVTRAKALTHSTAKWPWLAARAGGRHVVRLSYAVNDPEESVISYAVGDASRLLGVPLESWQVRAATQVVWPDAGPVQVDLSRVPPGIELAGSAAGLTGLAAIVAADAQAR